jgi:hypothetical protein
MSDVNKLFFRKQTVSTVDSNNPSESPTDRETVRRPFYLSARKARRREISQTYWAQEQGEIDTGMEKLLQKLDQGGPRSRASYRDGETTIAARRRGGRLDLDISGAGSGRIEATMPWAVADCLLGKTTTIDKTITSSIKVKVTNEDGRNFSFQLN